VQASANSSVQAVQTSAVKSTGENKNLLCSKKGEKYILKETKQTEIDGDAGKTEGTRAADAGTGQMKVKLKLENRIQ
jgi:hypothetical protein